MTKKKIQDGSIKLSKQLAERMDNCGVEESSVLLMLQHLQKILAPIISARHSLWLEIAAAYELDLSKDQWIYNTTTGTIRKEDNEDA